jgi:ribosome biogenesis GTPase A
MSSRLMLCDCPGIVFPRLDVSLPMQVGKIEQKLAFTNCALQLLCCAVCDHLLLSLIASCHP